MADDRITIKLGSLRNDVDAEAFVEAMRDTLACFHELNKAASQYGSVNLEWRITDAGRNSPLFATLHPVSTAKDNGHYGPRVIDAFVSGVQSLESGDDPPPLWNEAALRLVAALGRTRVRGITSIDFITQSRKVSATKAVIKHASQAAVRLELEREKRTGKYTDYGTLEGVLRDLMGSTDRLVLEDELTGDTTSCYFTGEEHDKQARQAWKGRVAVTGEITYDRATGSPVKMKVDEIRQLRDRSALPQLESFGIDLTGGVDSADLIRALRDDD